MIEEKKVYRITAKCVSRVCLHKCTCSFLSFNREPDFGFIANHNPRSCILHNDQCAWMVKSFEEVPELTAYYKALEGKE